ncbi:4Fe-4S dicluster domain-containing protein [Selenihalanaerobacter shriftii]|uniref:Heterodisulfide reductase subunit C n=1 Tax=Selenihalanaerobacter shriftii TaxID=142842 RepID=A0A1T4MJ71_9FIRM|nr:4Fe-4S dicluster domain-containing protein [Selenihalanaerobacter shriftii]SJZ67160.1 heterodisulfide reductase subunit C [Selenihalanaerobacter shriftii]
MINLSAVKNKNQGFKEKIETESGQSIKSCYQCGKCTGGCPLSYAMDYAPRQIVRMVQLNMKDKVLNNSTIWLCATCSTCTARCPREVDLAAIMDSLRIEARHEGVKPKEKNVALFHDVFLNSVKKGGRVFEMGMTIEYNMKSGNLMQDAELGLPMFLKNKISLTPDKIKGINEVQKIFNKVRRMEGDK